MSDRPKLVALPMTSDEAFHQEAARCIDQIKHQFQADQARLITRISHGGTLPEMRSTTDAAWLLGEIVIGLDKAIDIALGHDIPDDENQEAGR